MRDILNVLQNLYGNTTHPLGHRINKMQVYLWISTDVNNFMLPLVKTVEVENLSVPSLSKRIIPS